MNKTILTDCDGVLLNWDWAFITWCKFKGIVDEDVVIDYKKYDMVERLDFNTEVDCPDLVREFNSSAAIGFLPPLRDAVEYVTKLGDEGWRFVVITSMSTNPYAIQLRIDNLTKMFGPVFDEITSLDTGADKTFQLSKYQNSELYWIEDKIENAKVGVKLGLKSILMEHGHNMEYQGGARLVKNWHDVWRIVNS